MSECVGVGVDVVMLVTCIRLCGNVNPSVPP